MRIGYVIRSDSGAVVARVGQYAGVGAVNVAEYLGIIAALRHAFRLGFDSVRVSSDSQLVIRQICGRYKVKHRDLKRLHREAKDILRCFRSAKLRWVPREQNTEADALSRAIGFEQIDLGTPPRGGGRSDRSLFDWQACRIREALNRGASEHPLARAFGISATSIRLIRLCRSYNTANLDNLPDWSATPPDAATTAVDPFPAPTIYTTFPEELPDQTKPVQ